MKISIMMLTMNRPIRLLMTCLSTIRSLESVNLEYSIVIVDQGSRSTGRIATEILSRLFEANVIYLPENVGMANGWALAIDFSQTADCYLLLEDDWFCLRNPSLLDPLLLFLSFPETWFCKLRNLSDVDNFGKHSPIHSPYNSPGYDYAYESVINKFGLPAYRISSEWTDFTFNPIFLSARALTWVRSRLENDETSNVPARSGENVIDRHWRSKKDADCLVVDGPFRHMGFYKMRYWFTLFPYYLSCVLVDVLRLSTKRIKRSKTS